MPALTPTRRMLRSQFLDLLVGPHGIDRYLELIRGDLTVKDARAEVLAVHRQTSRSVTLTLRPNRAWEGFRAGQFVRVGVEIDGIRRTRTYSPACSQHEDGLLELTITVHPQGLVSRHLQSRILPGTIVHLGQAQGEFVLPDPAPERLVLISGGSGVTPVMSMLRTLRDEGHRGEVAFVHYARTAADWLYKPEVEAIAARNPDLRVEYVATRQGGGGAGRQGGDVATRQGGVRLSEGSLRGLVGDLDDVTAAVCGPPPLLDAVHEIFPSERVLAETFTPPTLTVSGEAAQGTLRFTESGAEAAIRQGTLLEQAEAAGLSPEFGCRMGICHTCTCRKRAGAVRDVRTGELSEEEDEDIQLCVSVPEGDVALEI